ncbi:MAG: hypothetical protein QXH07_07715 [Thermoplasmata archaeon]
MVRKTIKQKIKKEEQMQKQKRSRDETLKKNKKLYFGYKLHILIDGKHSAILNYSVTIAVITIHRQIYRYRR